MSDFTCPTCGKRMQGDMQLHCPACNAAAASDSRKQAAHLAKALALLGAFAAIAVTATCVLVLVLADVSQSGSEAMAINHMKQISLACHAYEDARNALPTPRLIASTNNLEVQLSWRVSLLPYLGHMDVFNAFDETLPWDHARNAALQNQMPTCFTYPHRNQTDQLKLTHFQFLTGPDTLFPDNTRRRLRGVNDGLWKTILFAEADQPATWTAPIDIAIRPDQPLPLPKGRFLAAMANDSVRRFDRANMNDTILRQLINPNDQKPDRDWDD